MDSKNLAIIGASRDPFKPGAMLLQVLKNTGFSGKIAGVNPKGGESAGVKLYTRLDEIPFDVDLAVLLIPPEAVPRTLIDCAREGIKGVVISSEGFAEAGSSGIEYQKEVADILRSTGMRGFGPNTLGIINTATGLTTSYFSNREMLIPGSIGFAGQSGIFVGALLRYLGSIEGLRISKGMGLGNKADIDECDALDYFMDDEQTRTIGLYLEDIRDGRRFLETAGGAGNPKPILLLKGGRTPQGALASATHTASLALDDALLDGALRQAGILRMEGIDELVSTLMGFEWMPVPGGNSIALVTFSGAMAIMSIDVAVREGLGMVRFSDETLKSLSSVISTPLKAQNPVDIFPDMMTHGYEKTISEIMRTLLADDDVHGIVFISFAISGAELYQPLVEVINENRSKPVFVSLVGAKDDVRDSGDYLLQARIPCYPYPEMSIRVFSHMWNYAKRVRMT